MQSSKLASEEPEHTLLDDETTVASNECDLPTWRLGLLLALAYSLNYFWRYPIFMLPKGPGEILDKHVVTSAHPLCVIVFY